MRMRNPVYNLIVPSELPLLDSRRFDASSTFDSDKLDSHFRL